TLPGFSTLRRMNLWPPPSITMSECAAAKPSRLSVSTLSTALMNFFMVSSRWSIGPKSVKRFSDSSDARKNGLAAPAGDAGDLVDEFVDGAVERGVLLGIAEI